MNETAMQKKSMSDFILLGNYFISLEDHDEDMFMI